MTTTEVIIVGGGISGLACARRLAAAGRRFLLLEASDRIGGRIRTDRKDGFLLDRGFQVLQTAYPEARRVLDYPRLGLHRFAPGVVIRFRGRFYTVADPLRRPRHLIETLRAPIGSFADRLRLARLARRASGGALDALIAQPETEAMAFLRKEGFSAAMIERFFVPFFGGVCLDPKIRASSRVLLYVLRMFVKGDAALPKEGMEQIPLQLSEPLPKGSIRTGVRVRAIQKGEVILDDGAAIAARAVVAAVEAPEACRLLGLAPDGGSVSETCLYFAGQEDVGYRPFLLLNGDGEGPINNVAVPSSVSPAYAPAGRSLVSAVVLGRPADADDRLRDRVRLQLMDWFGAKADTWEHLATVRIPHALPDQSPPTSDPSRSAASVRPGIYVCGEYGSLPGIQWALVSGRRTAEAVSADLGAGRAKDA